jgi:hypothetical protein
VDQVLTTGLSPQRPCGFFKEAFDESMARERTNIIANILERDRGRLMV